MGKNKGRRADGKVGEMSWADVSAALSAGARPQDVVTGVRELLSAGTNNNNNNKSTNGRGLSPPASPPPASNDDVSALYRKPLLPGTARVQLCYLRAPLSVLETLDNTGGHHSGDMFEGMDMDLDTNKGGLRFDTEFTFDVLSRFKPRLIAPIRHDSLSLPRATAGPNGGILDVEEEEEAGGGERGPTDLKTLGRLLAKGRGVGLIRSRRLSYSDWAEVYPIYEAYTAFSSPGDAAIALVRDSGSGTLCRYILKEIAPKLAHDGVADVVAACARTIRMKTDDVAATIEGLQKTNPTGALDVLESFLM